MFCYNYFCFLSNIISILIIERDKRDRNVGNSRRQTEGQEIHGLCKCIILMIVCGAYTGKKRNEDMKEILARENITISVNCSSSILKNFSEWDTRGSKLEIQEVRFGKGIIRNSFYRRVVVVHNDWSRLV